MANKKSFEDMNDEEIYYRLSIPQPGIVTFKKWFAAPNGQVYACAFSKQWRVITDRKTVEVLGFKTSEHWQFIAMNDQEKIAMLVPGCEVKNYLLCEAPTLGVPNLYIIT